MPAGLGPLSAMQLAALVSTLCQLPLLFVDIKRLAKLAMVGLTSSGMVLAMVWSCALLDPHRSAMPQQVRPWKERRLRCCCRCCAARSAVLLRLSPDLSVTRVIPCTHLCRCSHHLGTTCLAQASSAPSAFSR